MRNIEESYQLPTSFPKGWPWNIEFHETNTSKAPKVSVVVLSFNHEATLEETLRSIILQNYANLELIVADRNSTDGSKNIIEKYGHHINEVIYCKEELITTALNLAFNIATGEICTFLKGNEFYFPNALNSISKYFQQDSLQWFAFSAEYETSNGLSKVIKAKTNNFHEFVVQKTIPRQAAFWKSEAVAKPFFNNNYQFVPDHDFFINLYHKFGKPLISNEIITYMHQRNRYTPITLERKLNIEREILTLSWRQKLPKKDSYRILSESERKENLDEMLFLNKASRTSRKIWLYAVWRSVILSVTMYFGLRNNDALRILLATLTRKKLN